MLKKSLLLTISLLISPVALALEPAFEWGDWGEWTGGFTVSKANWHPATFKTTAQARISHSVSGSKVIFFSFYPKNYSLECSEETKNNRNEKIIFYVNGQPIKGIWNCVKFTDTKEAYYSFSGSTEAGRSFIVNAFKEGEYVAVEAKGERYEFSADGFTTAWNATTDAL